MLSSKIYCIIAREILDSRGNPTISATAILESGYRGTFSVPSGASKGKYEAIELRDQDPNRYMGNGVLKAVGNINNQINNALKGIDAFDQNKIDQKLISLDGTPNKSKLGANATLATSCAIAVAAAKHKIIPLYKYLNNIYQSYNQVKIEKIPTPMFNMINGGLHGAGNLNFQEFHVIPATSKSFSNALEIGVVLYYAIKKVLINRNATHSVGDEGGFAPNLFTNLSAFEVIHDAIKNSAYKFGLDIFLGLDLAASVFHSVHGYQIKDRPQPYQTDEFIEYLIELHNKFHLLLLEDALDEDDWDGWAKLTSIIGKEVLVVGDDLLVTNIDRLTKAISLKSCSTLLAKLNQIGTLSEYLKVVSTAQKNNIKVITSHRSGETTDTFIADLAVATQSDYVKFGAPARGERVVKYNRLLEIEKELGLK